MSEEAAPPFDAGSVTDVRRARKAARLTAVETETGIRAMLSTPFARRVMWEFFTACAVFSQEYSSESGAMYFRAGERNAALRLFAMIPEDLKAQMADEQKEKPDA